MPSPGEMRESNWLFRAASGRWWLPSVPSRLPSPGSPLQGVAAIPRGELNGPGHAYQLETGCIQAGKGFGVA